MVKNRECPTAVTIQVTEIQVHTYSELLCFTKLVSFRLLTDVVHVVGEEFILLEENASVQMPFVVVMEQGPKKEFS